MTFDGTTLVPSAKARILGIIIDVHLTWEAHVSLVVRRCYATLRGLSKLIPHIMYCTTVWGGCGTTQKKRVQKILNQCARVVFSVRKFEHVSPLLEELQWASVDRRVCERDIAMVHQLLYAPQCLRHCISYRADVSARDIRATATGQLQLPRVRTELAIRFFAFRALSLWNEAPANVREAKTRLKPDRKQKDG